MYADKKIGVRLICKLYPLIKSRVAVVGSGIINTDIVIILIKYLF